MFNLTRIREQNWEHYMSTGLKRFMSQQSKGWSPELNDQDGETWRTFLPPNNPHPLATNVQIL
jgi:hypothetical protein